MCALRCTQIIYMGETMSVPTKISASELTDQFLRLLAKVSPEPEKFVAVTDSIPDQFSDAISRSNTSEGILVYLTRYHAQHSPAASLKVSEPLRELRGTIGSLFIFGHNAIYRLDDDWYRSEDDPELVGMLRTLGSAAIEYTQYEENES